MTMIRWIVFGSMFIVGACDPIYSSESWPGNGNTGYDYGYNSGDASGNNYGYNSGDASGDNYGYNSGDAYGYTGNNYGYTNGDMYGYTGNNYGYTNGDTYGYTGNNYGYNSGDASGYTGDNYGYNSGDTYGYTGNNYGYTNGDTYGYTGNNYGYNSGDASGYTDYNYGYNSDDAPDITVFGNLTITQEAWATYDMNDPMSLQLLNDTITERVWNKSYTDGFNGLRHFEILQWMKEVTAKDRLYNDLLVDLDQQNIKFTGQQVDTLGKGIVGDLTSVLWDLDPHHSTFSDRSCYIPKPFRKYTGYNDFRLKHQRKPQLSVTFLQGVAEKIAMLLMLPYFSGERCKHFKDVVESLNDSVIKMKDYLTKANERMSNKHTSSAPVRSFTDNFSFCVKLATESLNISVCYQKLAKFCEKLEPYQYLDLIDFEPTDATERRKWLSTLQLPFDFGYFVYMHGNNLGNMNVIWKQPPENERESSCDIKCINDIKSQVPVFATRAMRKEFIERYSGTTKMKPMVARSVFKYLTNQELTAETAAEKQIDDRLEFLMSSDDPKLVMDLRKNNGKIANPEYDEFWNELGCMLDEQSVVNERRKPTAQYMPLAISVTDLKDQVLKRLPPGTEAPSRSWIHLNFHPVNSFVKSAVQYTGRFHVKRCVQQRILRARHVDADYTYIIYKYLKEFAVEFKEHVHMQCLDDKAIIPIGEPGKPIGATQRRHNSSLTTPGNEVLALDHDYHLCGIVPSVCLVVDIPESRRGSFYHGNVHITIKDKVLQASSPLRHSTETVAIVREHYSDDNVNLNKPILVRYTDGGPDHRTNFASVQLSAILEFIALDLDMYIACRTAPNQSYNNPAERIMSLLNLGLQNVALSRSDMATGYEMQIRSLNSLKLFRKRASDQMKAAFVQSLDAPIAAVKNIFSRLQRKHGKVYVHDACREDDMADLKSLASVIKPGIDFQQNKSAADTCVAAFMERHCHMRHYSFQIKKCNAEQLDSCPYCTLNPPRLDNEIFSQLSFLPDPVLNESGEYREYQELRGTQTDEKDMPSKKQKPTSSDRDKKFKSIFVAEKVRGFVTCHECGKRRVIFSRARLNQKQIKACHLVQDELLYSCGATLFPGGEYQDTILVREGINCSSPMETQYYADKTESYDPVCYYCGDLEDLQDVTALREDFNIVRPICNTCAQKGYKACTRSAKKLKKPAERKAEYFMELKYDDAAATEVRDAFISLDVIEDASVLGVIDPSMSLPYMESTGYNFEHNSGDLRMISIIGNLTFTAGAWDNYQNNLPLLNETITVQVWNKSFEDNYGGLQHFYVLRWIPEERKAEYAMVLEDYEPAVTEVEDALISIDIVENATALAWIDPSMSFPYMESTGYNFEYNSGDLRMISIIGNMTFTAGAWDNYQNNLPLLNETITAKVWNKSFEESYGGLQHFYVLRWIPEERKAEYAMVLEDDEPIIIEVQDALISIDIVEDATALDPSSPWYYTASSGYSDDLSGWIDPSQSSPYMESSGYNFEQNSGDLRNITIIGNLTFTTGAWNSNMNDLPLLNVTITAQVWNLNAQDGNGGLTVFRVERFITEERKAEYVMIMEDDGPAASGVKDALTSIDIVENATALVNSVIGTPGLSYVNDKKMSRPMYKTHCFTLSCKSWFRKPPVIKCQVADLIDPSYPWYYTASSGYSADLPGWIDPSQSSPYMESSGYNFEQNSGDLRNITIIGNLTFTTGAWNSNMNDLPLLNVTITAQVWNLNSQDGHGGLWGFLIERFITEERKAEYVMIMEDDGPAASGVKDALTSIDIVEDATALDLIDPTLPWYYTASSGYSDDLPGTIDPSESWPDFSSTGDFSDYNSGDTTNMPYETYNAMNVSATTGVVMDGGVPKLALYCNTTTDAMYKYKVEWFADSESIYRSDFLEEDAVDEFYVTNDDLLISGYALEKVFRCSVDAYLLDGTGPVWTGVSSDGYPVELADADYEIRNGEDLSIPFFIDMPLPCPEGTECYVDVKLKVEPEGDNSCEHFGLAFKNGHTCGQRIYGSSDYSEIVGVQFVNLTTRNNFKYQLENISYSLSLTFEPTGQVEDFWRGTFTQRISVTVLVDETNELLNGSYAYVTNDPSVCTVDGICYSLHEIGYFLLYRNKQQLVEVQIATEECQEGGICTCGVIIRAGQDAALLDHCSHLHTTTMLRSGGDNHLHIREAANNIYEVFLPRGTLVVVAVSPGTWWFPFTMLNILILPSPYDVLNTEGLIGNFNGNPWDDLSDDTDWSSLDDWWLESEPVDFIGSWRLTEDDALWNKFSNDEQVELADLNEDDTLCVCNGNDVLCSKQERNICENEGTSKIIQLVRRSAERYNTKRKVKRELHWDMMDRSDLHRRLDLRNERRKAQLETRTRKKRQAGCDYETAYNICKNNMTSKCPKLISENVTVMIENNTDTIKACARCKMLDCSVNWEDSSCLVATGVAVYAIDRDDSLDAEVVARVDPVLCPNLCCGNGDCINGDCSCYDGFSKDDCSFNNSQVPNMITAGNESEVCPPPCDQGFRIMCDGISEITVCRAILWQVLSDFTVSTLVNSVQCTIELLNNYEATITVSIQARRRRRSTDSGSSVIANFYDVSLSNDGSSYGSSTPVVVLDSTCLTYSGSGDNVSVVLQSNYCLIDGICYQDGTNQTGQTCNYCDVATDTFSWTLTSDYCLINDVCYTNGTVKSGDTCKFCNSTADSSDWTTDNETASCLVTDSDSSSASGMQGYIIAVIVLSVVLVLGGSAVGGFFLWKKYQASRLMSQGLYDNIGRPRFALRVAPTKEDVLTDNDSKDHPPPDLYQQYATPHPASERIPDNLYTERGNGILNGSPVPVLASIPQGDVERAHTPNMPNIDG